MNCIPSQKEIGWNKLKPVIRELSKKKAEELKNGIEKSYTGVDENGQLLLM